MDVMVIGQNGGAEVGDNLVCVGLGRLSPPGGLVVRERLANQLRTTSRRMICEMRDRTLQILGRRCPGCACYLGCRLSWCHQVTRGRQGRLDTACKISCTQFPAHTILRQNKSFFCEERPEYCEQRGIDGVEGVECGKFLE